MSRRSRAVAAPLLFAAVLGSCVVSRYDVTYDDVFTARAEDAVDRGWVPAWLPEGSTEIRSAFDPEDGTSILTATLGDDRASLDEACQSTDGLVMDPVLTADWFPDDVTSLGPVLACDDDRLVVLVDGVVHAWTPEGVAPTEPE